VAAKPPNTPGSTHSPKINFDPVVVAIIIFVLDLRGTRVCFDAVTIALQLMLAFGFLFMPCYSKDEG
jgi:hypothetical protein